MTVVQPPRSSDLYSNRYSMAQTTDLNIRLL